MSNIEQSKFIRGLQVALQKERASRRIYRALAQRASNEGRRNELLGLTEAESRHGDR